MIKGISAGGGMPSLSASDLDRYLNDYQALGVDWIRFDFDWSDIQSSGPSSYNWSPYDAVVNAAYARGIKVLGVIGYCPTWALPSGCSDVYHCPPLNVADYAAFAASVASRYSGMGVHTWEIWNEPNGGTFSIAAYTALIKASYTAIKQVDGCAFVLTGGTQPAATSGSSYSPPDFLTGIYANGGKGYFDAVAHHPYCYSSGFVFPFYADWSAWSQMQDTYTNMRSVMAQNSDQTKKIWATEFGSPSGGGSNAISEADQSSLVKNAYNLFRSYSWSGPLFWYSYKDRCSTTTNTECYFGLVRADYSHKPAYKTYSKI